MNFNPRPEYYEAVSREDLAWRAAQAVKTAERGLSAGHLETKEMRNAISNVFRERLSLELEDGCYRLVTDWTYIPVSNQESRGDERA